MIWLRPPRYAYVVKPRHDLLTLVLDSVHPANLGDLPPSPDSVAFKGQQIGLGEFAEFFRRVFY